MKKGLNLSYSLHGGGRLGSQRLKRWLENCVKLIGPDRLGIR